MNSKIHRYQEEQRNKKESIQSNNIFHILGATETIYKSNQPVSTQPASNLIFIEGQGESLII